MKKKLFSILCVVSLTTFLLAGCGKKADSDAGVNQNNSQDSTNVFTYLEETDQELVSTQIMAVVDSISGNEYTLSVMNLNRNFTNEETPSGDVPTMPDGEAPSGNMPTMPDGEAPSGDMPTMPDGEAPSGDMPTMPSGDNAGESMQDGGMPNGDFTGKMENSTTQAVLTINDTTVLGETSLEEIVEGSFLTITFDENGSISEITISDSMFGGKTGTFGGNGQGADGGFNAGGGQASGVESYTAVTEYTEDSSVSDENFVSEGTDENAILLATNCTVTLDDITVTRISADSTGGDNASFYGVGSAILATDGTMTIQNAEIETDAAGAAGVFAYGSSVVSVADSTIHTNGNTAGGIHAAGGGTLYAWNLDVETEGNSSAAVRSDRGGGTMVVDGGTYQSNGVGSPAVYCTADIAIHNATLTATGSEAICMEGLNSIHLYDCDISGNMSDDTQNDTTWDIIVYQSMSGDSEVGNSTMQIIGGTLTSLNGGILYTTNTECDILFSGVQIEYAKDSEFFLMCTGNANERGWGTTGKNGSDCTFTADAQEMQGDIIWDSVSTLNFYMKNQSLLTGAFIQDESYAGEGGDGYASLYLSANSKWVVTKDSYLTNLYQAGSIEDEQGKSVTIIGTDGTVFVQGESNLTITVETYDTAANCSGAASVQEWSNYEVER